MRAMFKTIESTRWLMFSTLLAAMVSGVKAEEYDQPPINYSRSKPSNPVARLIKRQQAGKTELQHNRTFGYLRIRC